MYLLYSLFILCAVQIRSFCFADDIRLKQTLIPRSYQIILHPHLDAGNFTGQVSIELQAGGTYNYINLHAKDLDVKPEDTKLKRIEQFGSPEEIPINRVVKNEANETLTIYLNKTVYLGSYILEINYVGKVRDDMTGFYRTSYDYNGKKRWLGVTQFEPHYARRAFPCFDEPHFRTNFTMQFFVPSAYGVISNVKSTQMNQASTSNSQIIYTFNSYPKMPTYLLAWVIYEKYTFVSTEPYSLNGTEYKLWTRADYLNQTNHANTIASKLLDALASYLDVPYTLNKMDQIAIPDFKAGAMENWGIVTYREDGLLLVPDKISTSEDFRKSTMVIAHEFTHQWFGDLVTLDWWSYTWLNEAFARYFQYFITLEVYPDWMLEEQFVILALQPALEYDSTHRNAMTSNIDNTADINGKFDLITYSKGASVVRMMDQILTRTNFKSGLSRYIKSISGNTQVAKPEDLFNILATVAPSDLPYGFETIIRSWTDQSGYPVVIVRRTNNSTLTLSQERGLYISRNSTTLWYIPLTYTTKKESNFINTNIKEWLITKEKSTNISLGSQDDWIIFNIQQKGFYRVNYDISLWNAIIKQLKTDHMQIGSLNRAQLIDDVFYFVDAGILDLNIALDLSSYLINETDYAPWVSAVHNLNKLLNRFYGSQAYDRLKIYVRNLLTSVTKNVGYVCLNGDKMTQKLKRIKVLKFIASLDEPNALSTGQYVLNNFTRTSQTPHNPDVQSALLCSAVRNSNAFAWKAMFNLYLNTPYATQKIMVLNALTCTQNETLLKSLFVEAMAEEPKIRKQNFVYLYRETGSTTNGSKFLLNFIISNYTDLITYNNNMSSIIGSILEEISSKIYDRSDVNSLANFNYNKVKTGDDKLYEKINKIIDRINKSLDKTTREISILSNWLNSVVTTVSPMNPTASPTENPKKSSAPPSLAVFNEIFVVVMISFLLL